MKDNKITRKRYRLEVLESAVEKVYFTIEEYEASLDYHKERLSEELDKPEEERNSWRIDSYTDDLNKFTLKIEEAKKLIAELEKMV